MMDTLDAEKKSEATKSPASHRNRWIAVAVAVAVATAVAIYVVAQRPMKPLPARDKHEQFLAGMNAAYQAAQQAPEGKTPCETAWNGFDALQRKLAELGAPPATEKQPDRETFLAVCNDFSELEQQCLLPKYKAGHREQCAPTRDRLWAETAGGKKNLASIFGKRDEGGDSSAVDAPDHSSAGR